MLAYMPSYVKDFLTYKVGNKPPEYFMKPLYVITRDNMAKYADQLSEGHKAMFKTYPDYKMVVYPTVRNAFFRSEEHTSELQSLMRISYAVFCLKKKKKKIQSSISIKHIQNTNTSSLRKTT